MPGKKTAPKQAAAASARRKATPEEKPGLPQLLTALAGIDADIGTSMLLLMRISRLNEAYAAQMRQTFSPAELLVLSVLLLESPRHRLPPTELAARIVQSPGGMTKTLQRLERLGLILRVREEADRRALSVELTDEGLKAAKGHLALMAEQYAALFGGMSAKEFKALAPALRRLLTLLEEATGHRDSGSWWT